MSKNEIQIRDNVIKYNLERLPQFDDLSDAQFVDIFNSFGPDAFPEILRNMLNWIYRNFIELSAVHDVDFHYSDGTREGFEKTLERWQKNSSIMLNLRYPLCKFWLLPCRGIAYIKLRLSLRALRLFSFEYWDCSGSH